MSFPSGDTIEEVSEERPAKNPRRVFSKKGAVRPPFNPDLRKYWQQRHCLFSKYSQGVRLDAEGWFSVTPEAVAARTAELLAAGVPHPSPSLVFDMFLGVGGNAIQQALAGDWVIAMDIDADKVEMARHNARVYGVEHRIQFIVGDSTKLCGRLRASIALLSPPWGGPEYGTSVAEFRLASLRLDQCDGLHLFDLAAHIAPSVGLYLPASVSDAELRDLAARHPSQRCEKVELAWGGGKRKSGPPRAVLALFHSQPPHWLRDASVGVHTRRVDMAVDLRGEVHYTV
jgi:hypothetical protein